MNFAKQDQRVLMELSERIQRQRALPVLGPREEINVFVMIH